MKKIENKTRRRVTFSFASPDAKEVFVAGTFNGWDPLDDPSCPNRRSNPFGGENCILEV